MVQQMSSLPTYDRLNRPSMWSRISRSAVSVSLLPCPSLFSLHFPRATAAHLDAVSLQFRTRSSLLKRSVLTATTSATVRLPILSLDHPRRPSSCFSSSPPPPPPTASTSSLSPKAKQRILAALASLRALIPLAARDGPGAFDPALRALAFASREVEFDVGQGIAHSLENGSIAAYLDFVAAQVERGVQVKTQFSVLAFICSKVRPSSRLCVSLSVPCC